jgi:heptose I phosphotransferase
VVEREGRPTPTLAEFERAPGYRVQRTLSDRVNFVVADSANGVPTRFGKVYSKPGLAARLRQRTGVHPGLREAEALRRLSNEGIPVPAVEACGVEADGRTWIVTRAVAGGVPLDDALRAGRLDDPRRRRDVLLELAGLVRRLHESGIVHRDLYLCHVLVSPRDRSLTLIDFERALARRRLRWRVKDLAALLSSVPAGRTSRQESLRFLRAYLGSPIALREWARRVGRKAARIASHVPRRRETTAPAVLEGT